MKTTWYAIYFNDDTENEYFNGEEWQAVAALKDKNVLEVWECNNDETLSPKRQITA